MGVLVIDEGRAINVLLPSSDDDDPSMGRIVIANDGIVEHDMEDLDDEEIANVLVDAVAEARDRIAFCREALHNMGISPEDVAHLLK